MSNFFTNLLRLRMQRALKYTKWDNTYLEAFNYIITCTHTEFLCSAVLYQFVNCIDFSAKLKRQKGNSMSLLLTQP